MKKLIQNSYVAESSVHGWGGFASKNIRKGGIIEECPFVNSTDKGDIPDDILNYLFTGQTKGSTMVVLGYGAIYNHSKQCNAEYLFDEDKNVIVFNATRNIKKGEEIFVDYGKEYWASRKKNPK